MAHQADKPAVHGPTQMGITCLAIGQLCWALLSWSGLLSLEVALLIFG